LEGITRLHALVAQHTPADWADLPSEEIVGRVVVGIETDRGPWVTALRAAGYQVFAINPLSSARYRERYSTSGAKSDAGDAHVLAEIVRLDRDHQRQIARDTGLVDAVKLVARAHQTAVWERTRQVLRMRSTLMEYFPAVEAFEDLSAKDSLLLLARAPSPARVGKLTRSQVVSALRAARRHHAEAKADALLTVLRAPGLRQPETTEAAYAAVVVGQVGIITALNAQIAQWEEVVAEHFWLISISASRVWGWSSRPASWVNSATTRSGSVTSELGRTTPGKAQSPGRQGRRPSSWLGMPPTVGLATRFIGRRSQRSPRHRVRGPTTTRSESGRSVTTLLCASSRTGSSVSCTAASRPAPNTMKTPLGSTKTSLSLDINRHGMSARTASPSHGC
jgi:transposase